MTTNINNSPEYACRTCAKQECGCKDTECQLPCHFYTEQAEQESETETIGVIMGGELVALVEEYQTGAWPIYAAPVQQAEQEPFDMNDHPPHRLCECRKCMEYFTPLPDCDAFAASGKPIAEQKPVAVVEITYGREPECYVTGNIDDFPEGVFKLYAAPVRTKDLTDDEIEAIFEYWYSQPETEVWSTVDFARAVIAKFKEKNK